MTSVDPSSFQHIELPPRNTRRGMLALVWTVKAKSKLRKADREEQACG